MMKRLFASAIFLCVLALPFSWQARTQTEPSGKALLEAYVSAWNRRDFPALDKLLASDAVHEDMARPSRDVGPDEIKRDRKSTRLNSSHVAISYAVFCLKKKITHTYARAT